MNVTRRELWLSATGSAAAVVGVLFNFRRLVAFVRGQIEELSVSGTFGTVFLMGDAQVIVDWKALAVYDLVFKTLPFVSHGLFLAAVFAAGVTRKEKVLRDLIPVYLFVNGLTAVSDTCNLLMTDCHGEAGVFSSVRDTLFFVVFLVHRFAPIAFFEWFRRFGSDRLPRGAWLLLVCHAAGIVGMAAARICSYPAADHTEPCTLLVCALALLAASVSESLRTKRPS